jgi:DNA-binding transcriptional LysR family regulator
MKALDLEAVQAFVMVADLKSFTRTAEAMDTTQSAVSVKIKRLEDRLGRRLIERTPRAVRLSAEGQIFLNAARSLVAAHDSAMGSFFLERRRLIVGISHHIVGHGLPGLIKRISGSDPGLTLEMRVAASRDVLAELDRGVIDAAVVLRHDERGRGGQVLLEEEFAWMSAPEFAHHAGEPLRLATQADPCGVRSMAVKALDAAGIRWTEVFVGGGVTTIGAAAAAGLAIAALARRVAPQGTIDHGPRLGLPKLPKRQVVLHAAASDHRSRAALKLFAAAFRITA